MTTLCSVEGQDKTVTLIEMCIAIALSWKGVDKSCSRSLYSIHYMAANIRQLYIIVINHIVLSKTI